MAFVDVEIPVDVRGRVGISIVGITGAGVGLGSPGGNMVSTGSSRGRAMDVAGDTSVDGDAAFLLVVWSSRRWSRGDTLGTSRGRGLVVHKQFVVTFGVFLIVVLVAVLVAGLIFITSNIVLGVL